MITSFTLRDLRLLAKLQNGNVSLCPIEALTRPQSPLWAALTSLLPFDEGQAFTFVLNEQRRDGRQLQGFIQARYPLTRLGMYIERVTPGLDEDEDAQGVWSRLVNHIVTVAGERGIQRVFACVADESQEMAILLSAGFSVYAREDIFGLAPDAHPQAVAPGGIRSEQSVDHWGINQLYRAITPHLVQQAESPTGHTGTEWLSGSITWSQGEGFVLEDQEGIAGYGHLMPGRIGHWLTLLLHPRAYKQIDRLLDYALALLNYYPPYPVYCAVRDYQGGIRVPLEERGFSPMSIQCRLVKHTTARVKEPVRGLVPALEKRVEAPTTTVTPTKGP